MPSTFSTSLKLELPQNGEQSGIWGQTLNNDLILLESAITGITDLYLTGDATLTSYNGLPDEARNAIISCTGVLSSPANVIAPAVQKTYIITNNTGANVTIKTATGNGVTVLNTTSTLVYCDGTDFYQAVSLNNVTGNQTISGNEVIGANVTATGNLTVTSNVSSYNGNLTLYSNTSVITAAVNTGGYVPPTGTTAQRPSSPTGGMSRFNTDSGVYEIFNGTIWQPITGAYTVTFLLVAGGGAGGYGPFTFGGGGGGGGMLANVSSVQPGTAYTITIGAGGSSAGSSGANTTAFSNTAVGGGGGSNGSTGLSGGSGGGGDPYNSGGSGTSGQGFAGTRGAVINDGQTAIGGGGGGAGAAGGGTLGYAADGGAGNASSITGSSVYYAGGGGGAGQGSGTIARGGFGGTGGGGAGAGGVSGGSPTAAVAGTANKGGGGGAGGSDAGGAAGGGSGVAIISYPSATQRATGGNVTTYTSGGTTYWVHTFNSSGTFTA